MDSPPSARVRDKEYHTMRVLKRDGSLEDVSFDKVLHRIQYFSKDLETVDPVSIAQKIIARIYDKVPTSQLDELTAQICSSLMTEHPNYGILAARISISNHQKNTSPSFSETMSMLYHAKDTHGESNPLISEELWQVVQAHKEKLNSVIDYSRDFLFDYFGFKTLERSYLMKVNGKSVERPQHMIMRVALGIHGCDLKDALETYELISQKKFTHATPTLFNAGTPRAQLASCYLQHMGDSIDEIFKTVSDSAKISKYAGGIGIHVSGVRARNSYIRGTNGTSTGIIPMLRVLNNTARYVNQGGKRNGSIAIYLEPWHADVETFVDLRKNQGNEEERCRDLFLALWVPDLFMKRVQANADWTLMCPNECPGLTDAVGEEFERLYEKYEKEGRGKKTIKAQQLWFSIIKAQIETGTPYICYKDHANRKSNQKNLGTIKSSNLCVAPDTQILTDKGYQKIGELEGQDVNVWNGLEWSKVTIHKTGENQEMWRVSFSDGSMLECTGYHKFFIQEGYLSNYDNDPIHHRKVQKLETKSLVPGMKLMKWDFPVVVGNEKELKYAYTAGFASGDGCSYGTNAVMSPCTARHLKGKAFCKRHEFMEQYDDIPFNTSDNDLCKAFSYLPGKKCYLYGEKKNLLPFLDYRYSFDNTTANRIDVILHPDLNEKNEVPIDYSLNTRIRWLEGLSDSDGCVIHHQGRPLGIQISSVKKEFLTNLQKLLHTIGVSSKLNIMHPNRELRYMPDGHGGKKEYVCQPCFRVIIASAGIKKLKELGYSPKRLKLDDFSFTRDATEFIKVVSVERLNKTSDTFCFNEPKRHAGIFNGVLTGNCSEIIEYRDANETAVCNLASIALPSYVKDGKFNFAELHKIAQVVTKNLNKVIDRTFYPTPETRYSNLRHRPIGIGVQGLADTYALLRLPFDSPEAVQLNREIFETIYHGAVSASVAIAKKRAEWIEELWTEGVSLEREEELRKMLKLTDEENGLSKWKGAYATFAGSPASEGKFQFDLWEAQGSEGKNEDGSWRWDWDTLRVDMMRYGLRNSLLLAPMPTASTSQILGFTEAIEPIASNIYQRRTMAGEFFVINKYLVRDLLEMGLWSVDLKNLILANNGSIQNIPGIPDDLKKLYKTVWELKMKVLIDQAADRGKYVCQSQSLNLFIEDPDLTRISNMHFYSWTKGLKTGMYYLRTRAKAKTQAFTLDPALLKSLNKPQEYADGSVCRKEEGCIVCSS